MQTIGPRQNNSPALSNAFGIASGFDWQVVVRSGLARAAASWRYLTARRFDMPFDVKGAVWTDSLERQINDHLASGERFRF